MSNLLTKTSKQIWFWRLAIFECLSDAFVAGAMVWMAAVANQSWQDIDPTAKAVIKVSVAVVKVIKSFLSTTMATLKQNAPDFSVDDSPPDATLPKTETKPTA